MESKRIRTWEAVCWGALPGVLMMGWVLWVFGFRGYEGLHLLGLIVALLGALIYWRVNKRTAARWKQFRSERFPGRPDDGPP